MAYVKSLLKQQECVNHNRLIDINTKKERLEHIRNSIERGIDLCWWNKEIRELRIVGEANLCDFSALQFPKEIEQSDTNKV